jgi:hypothetical protein
MKWQPVVFAFAAIAWRDQPPSDDDIIAAAEVLKGIFDRIPEYVKNGQNERYFPEKGAG